MMHDPLLQVEDLFVRFAGSSRDAVSGVSFELARGDALAVLGPSGSGKTAAMRAVLGLVPADAEVRGKVSWRGRDLSSDPGRRSVLGREMAIVFQDPGGSLDPCHSVGSQLEETLAHCGWPDRKHRRRRCDELMSEVQLDPLLAVRFPHQLSGGEQQRVALALALAGDPELLVADEPTTSLDAITQSEILELMRDLVNVRGAALIFITHDLRAAEVCAQRALVLDHGKVVERTAVDTFRRTASSEALQVMVEALAGDGAKVPTEAPTRDPILCVRNLEVHREGRAHGRAKATSHPVLRSVSFELQPGEALGVVGRSGAGKTTLAYALGGFLRPTGGEVQLPPVGSGPRPAQMIFQNPTASLDPRLSILDSVSEAAAASGAQNPDEEARCALDDVGLISSLFARRPNALSGGERQRAAVARALAARPAVLIADEPASSLDTALRARFVDLLDRLRHTRDLGLILISHDLRLVRRCCPRIGVLDKGEMMEIVKNDDRPRSEAGRALWRASS